MKNIKKEEETCASESKWITMEFRRLWTPTTEYGLNENREIKWTTLA